jgi:hypothetical protein
VEFFFWLSLVKKTKMLYIIPRLSSKFPLHPKGHGVSRNLMVETVRDCVRFFFLNI